MTEIAPESSSNIRPISHRSTNDKVLELVAPLLRTSSRVLDLGAGEGYFSMRLGETLRARFDIHPSEMLSACDVTPGLFKYQDVTCDLIPTEGDLPYADASFDVVCSIEVVEHVQDQFKYCREIMRILRPGGTAILSTPNVLNMNSRYRTLHSGFATLFNPLSLSSADVVHTSGHIHPVSFYYLSYALIHAGALKVSAEYDRFKRSAFVPLILFSAFLLIGGALFRAKVQRRNPQVFRENAELLRAMQSWKMLTSRSIIVVATK